MPPQSEPIQSDPENALAQVAEPTPAPADMSVDVPANIPPVGDAGQPNWKKIAVFLGCMLLIIVCVEASRSYIYDRSHPPVSSKNLSAASSEGTIQNGMLPIGGSSAAAPASTSAGAGAQTSASAGSAESSVPSVTSWAYLVGNVVTGQIYLSKNIHEVLPIASLSKLTTALVARQFMDQDYLVPITQQVLDVYSDAYGLELGEKFPVSDMYYPLLLQSNDNAAEALAYAYDTETATGSADIADADPAAMPASTTGPVSASSTDSAFVGKMNEYTSELGMTDSHFKDASGLSDGNVSTAADLFTLAQFLYQDKFNDKLFSPNIFAITTLISASVATTSDHDAHDFISINPFAGDPAFVGGKTGRTDEAGETMLSIFNYQHDDETYPIVVIVLHSDYGTRQADTEKLLTATENDIAAGEF